MLVILQHTYVEQLLKHFSMQDATPVVTPMNPHIDFMCFKPTDNERADMKGMKYAELVGGLNYLSVILCPDNQYTTSILAHFMSNPARAHWEATWHNLRYLKGMKDHALMLGTMSDVLKLFSDCNWAMNADRQSISGCAVLYNSAAITWYSRKQTIVTQSTCEAKYIGQTKAACELVHIVVLMCQLPFLSLDGLPMLFCDNQSTIKLAKTGNFSARMKHIDVKYRYVTKAHKDRSLRLAYTLTMEMVADILTKALPCEKLEYFHCLLGMCPA
jgi:hypothetical protein